jgi:hypothetical protein
MAPCLKKKLSIGDGQESRLRYLGDGARSRKRHLILLRFVAEVSNSDHLYVGDLSDHEGRDEHFYSLFQILS